MYTLILDSMLFRTSGCPFIRVIRKCMVKKSGIRFVQHVSFGEFLAAASQRIRMQVSRKKTQKFYYIDPIIQQDTNDKPLHYQHCVLMLI